MQWFYTAFWVFIIGMILWQFYDYNSGLDHAIAVAGPKQQHFYFLNGQTNTASLDAPPKPDGADVKQVGCTYTDNVPYHGSFTAHVSLKNYGNMKAIGVQVQVTPYRGTMVGLENDNSPATALPDSDPIAQINQWVSFPDLAPGETVTKDAVFGAAQKGYTQGDNANPQVLFQTEKPKAAPVPPATP